MTDDFNTRLATALGEAYRLERELGGGGMSRVFVAEELALGRKVVVKVLPPDMGAGLNAERFRREIQLAASLQHPHIVALHAAGRYEDLAWFTMPFIDGESLRTKLAREGELPIAETVRILREVADSLAYAHEHGVVHRDIKPDNVLISGRHALVTDFGVAKALSGATGESALTSVGIALGTPTYMAPEQAAADPHVDHRADIYAFGAMAYEMLTGQPPFSGSPQAVLAAHVTQAPDFVTNRRTSVPPALAALVMRCLEKKPADRYQNAAEVHQLLEQMATPSGGMAPTSATAAVSQHNNASTTGVLTPVRVGMVTVIAAAIALVVWSPWSTGESARALDPKVVAVLPFRVAGADPALHYLREGMMDLLHAKLTGEGGPRAADVQSVVAAVRSGGGADTDVTEDALQAVVVRVGAGLVIQGSIVGQPDRFVLNASLLKMPGAKPIAQTSINGSKDSIFVVVDQLAQRLLALGGGASEMQLEALTTTSLPALRAYLDGQAAYRRGEGGEATTYLERAVALDSTFALAASALIEAVRWAPLRRIDDERVSRLAWQYRDRLHPLDQQFLSIRLGSQWPAPTPPRVQIEDLERLTKLLPESPLAWNYLGDVYFHYGTLAGVTDFIQRATNAFDNSDRLDPNMSTTLEHGARLAVLNGDIEKLRAWSARRIVLDSTAQRSLQTRIELAFEDPESKNRAWAEAALADSLTSEFAIAFAVQFTTSPFAVARMDSVLSRAQRRTTDAGLAINLAFQRVLVYEAQGNTGKQHALMDSIFAAASKGARPDPVADLAVRWERMLSATTVQAARLVRTAQYQPTRYDVYWELKQGNVDEASRLLNMIRSSVPSEATEANYRIRAQHAILDAAVAKAQRAPNAGALLAAADTATRDWHLSERWTALWSELLESEGQHAAALRAIYHDYFPLATPPLEGIVGRLFSEGRLAVTLGENERALKAYRTYLLWRENPDAELVPERDWVRAEVARLEKLK